MERGRAGSALITVLWCLVILSVVIVSALKSTRLELRASKNFGDIIAARCLAIAGVETAKARLWTELDDLREAGEPAGWLQVLRSPGAFKDIPFGRGLFRVIRATAPGESAEPEAFGIADESARLNVNVATQAELLRLPGMTADMAAAVVDWRDEDDQPGELGAERDDYLAAAPPRLPRNGPFETLAELLLVRGVTPELLYGEDANRNGLLDPEEDDGAATAPPDDADHELDAGWSALVTIDSSVENTTARGEARVDLTQATEAQLAEVAGISTELATAIVVHRGKKNFESIADLLDVEGVRAKKDSPNQPKQISGTSGPAPQPRGGGGRGRPAPERIVVEGAAVRGGGNEAPAGGPAPDGRGTGAEGDASGGETSGEYETTGEKIVNEELLKEIADEVTVQKDRMLPGRININTAPAEVLACLDGMDYDRARAVVAHRRGRGDFRSVADLLDVSGMTREVFKQVAERVDVRSNTYRIAAEGIVPSTGARRRLEVAVRVRPYDVLALSWRELP